MSYEASMNFCQQNAIPVYIIPKSNLVAANLNSWTTIVASTIEDLVEVYKKKAKRFA